MPVQPLPIIKYNCPTLLPAPFTLPSLNKVKRRQHDKIKLQKFLTESRQYFHQINEAIEQTEINRCDPKAIADLQGDQGWN